MTLHYHGLPITPLAALRQLAGRCFCVSFARPEQDRHAHELGQSVMLDNGAFSVWRRGAVADWVGYYAWADRWLDYPTTWAVIPDVIDGGAEAQDALLREWPHGVRGAPVWHMDEPIDRLLRLADAWPRLCFGSAGAYAEVGSDRWHARCGIAWNALMARHRRPPCIHMLRGMQAVRWAYPFASVDSTDVARNHARDHNTPAAMAARWDACQCPGRWGRQAEQLPLLAAAA